MRIAQRGTSTTTSGGYCVDRIQCFHGGTDEAPTFAQADVASGTTPYTLGFRKSLKITNGNQTSGAGAADYVWLQYKIEAQDIANSGWNYVSSSSNITLSFWVKSSVAQDFKGFIQTSDGTAQSYPFATGSLSADTWTKITKTIPGNSNLTFDNNNDVGMNIQFLPFFGTDYTNNSATENAWQAYSGSARCKDSTSTWYTTNDATFELTGVQLEVGSVATDFEHRSYGQELALCQRYYEEVYGGYAGRIEGGSSDDYDFPIMYKVTKRADATLTLLSSEENVFSSVTANNASLSSRKESCIVRGNNVVNGGNMKYVFGRISASAEL
tara:strand:- start:187 stop:1164 length:978 start_codon:yes stop_codon:yes gene_type:complete